MKKKWAFRIYVLVLTCLLFARPWMSLPENYCAHLRLHSNLQPFGTIMLYFNLILHDFGPFLRVVALANLLGNVLIFVPMGHYLAKRFSLWQGVFIGLLMLIFIELTQWITLTGSLDIDDILLNLTGILIGFALKRQKIPLDNPPQP